MEAEWDAAKAATNLHKHGIRFADAVFVLDDPLALTLRDDSFTAEERWVALGADGFGRLLVVVYSWRSDRVRIISARKATPTECNAYEGYR